MKIHVIEIVQAGQLQPRFKSMQTVMVFLMESEMYVFNVSEQDAHSATPKNPKNVYDVNLHSSSSRRYAILAARRDT